MGSWNETCMLSGLPITGSDEVVMILLTESPYAPKGSPSCYHNDFYFVRSIPLFGTYADYGRMELLEGEEDYFKLVKQQFELDLISRTQNERDKILSLPKVEIGNFNLSTLLDWLHEGHVAVKQDYLHRQLAKKIDTVNDLPETDTTYVTKIFIRKDVWDSILTMTIDGWKGPITFETYLKGSKNFVNDLEKLAEKKKQIKTFDDEVEARMMMLDLQLELTGRDNVFASHFGPGFGGGDPPFGMSKKALMDMIKSDFIDGKLSKEEFFMYCNRFAELCMVESIMVTTRHSWHPTTGTGSQSTNWDETIELHLKMALCGAKAGFEEMIYFNEGLNEITKEEYEELNEWDRKSVEQIRKFQSLHKKIEEVVKLKPDVEMEKQHKEKS